MSVDDFDYDYMRRIWNHSQIKPTTIKLRRYRDQWVLEFDTKKYSFGQNEFEVVDSSLETVMKEALSELDRL